MYSLKVCHDSSVTIVTLLSRHNSVMTSVISTWFLPSVKLSR